MNRRRIMDSESSATTSARLVYGLIQRFLSRRSNPRVLDAGCGSQSRWVSPGEVHLVGVDKSQKQLDRCEHLDEAICADLQEFPLIPLTYDVIICHDVLEHVEQPAQLIRRFHEGLKPGGLLVLAGPNYRSFWAQVTKYTPHLVHIWYYRFYLQQLTAGRDDRGSFPTFMSPETAPERVMTLWSKLGGRSIHQSTFVGRQQQTMTENSRLFRFMTKGISWVEPKWLFSSYLSVLQRST